MSNAWQTPENMRANKAKHRAKWRSMGLHVIHEIYVHPKDFPAVARYVDSVNARRFRNGQLPPRLIEPPRPRGSVTILEASQRLGIATTAVFRRLDRGLLDRLPVRGFHRTVYLTEASVRREERIRSGFDTRKASRYLAARGVTLSPKTLINRRFKKLAPSYTIGHNKQVRYSRTSLNRFIGKYKGGDA